MSQKLATSSAAPKATAADGRSMSAQNLSFRQIEILHAVMTTRSITAASRLLAISQPSLSRTLRRLEDTLKVQLFERGKRGLVPSSEAIQIFAQIDPIVRKVAGLGSAISHIVQGGASVFRLGATASVARFDVPQVLQALASRNPALEFFFDVLTLSQIEDYLVSGQGECVVTIVPVAHPSLETSKVGTGSLVALVPAAHPLAAKPALSAEDLDGVDFISFEEGGPHYRVVAAFLRNVPGAPRVRAVVRFSETAIALANQGFGIALVDSFSVKGPVGSDVVVVPVRDAPQFEVFVHWSRDRPRSRHVEAIIAGLKERISLA